MTFRGSILDFDVTKVKESTPTILDFDVTKVPEVDSQAQRKVKSFAGGAISAFKGMYDFTKTKLPDLDIPRSPFDKGKIEEDKIEKLFNKALEATSVNDPTFTDKIAGAAGSSVSFLIPGAGAMKVSKALSLTPKIAAIFGTGASAVLEAAAEGGSVLDQSLSKGKTQEEAERDANETFFANLPVNFLLDKWIFKGLKKGKKLVSSLKGAGQEASQEAIQQLISNIAVDDDISSESLRGLGESALIGGIVGGGIGGVKSAAETIQERSQKPDLNIEQTPTIEQPLPVETQVEQALATVQAQETVSQPEMFETEQGQQITEETIIQEKAQPQEIVQEPQQIPQVDYELNRGIEQQKESKESTGQFFSKIFVPVSTRLRKINPKLQDSLRKFEFNILKNKRKSFAETEPFLKSVSEINENDFKDLDLALKNSDIGKIRQITNKYGLNEQYEKTVTELNDVHKRATEAGLDINFVENFYPRKVADPIGFMDHIQGTEEWSQINRAIEEEQEKTGNIMDIGERADFVNSMLRGFPKNRILLSRPGHAKERTVQTVTPELNQFYKNSSESLVDYIETMNDAIESRRFFGKSPKDQKDSIGWYVNELVKNGEISQQNEKIVQDILEARFNQKGPGDTVRLFKNMAYMYTLNNPGNAITQVGDLAWSLYENGGYPTVKALLSKKAIKKEDLGIDAISEEFTGKDTSAKAVSKLFKLIGLEKFDRLGKETFINANIEKMSRQAKKNNKELQNELIRVFGKEDAVQVQEDIANKNITDEVRYMLFANLADFQPISMAEMPEAYLKGGNARIFYMLKSFTIKQIDIFRREAFETMRENPAKGLKQLIKLASAFTVMGVASDTLKNILFNRDFDISDMTIDNMLKLMAFSKWQIYSSRRDGLVSTFMKSILPPIPFIDDVYKDTVKAMNNGDVDVKNLKTLKGLPLVGKLYYWWFGGGKDITESKQKPKRRRLIKRKRG